MNKEDFVKELVKVIDCDSRFLGFKNDDTYTFPKEPCKFHFSHLSDNGIRSVGKIISKYFESISGLRVRGVYLQCLGFYTTYSIVVDCGEFNYIVSMSHGSNISDLDVLLKCDIENIDKIKETFKESKVSDRIMFTALEKDNINLSVDVTEIERKSALETDKLTLCCNGWSDTDIAMKLLGLDIKTLEKYLELQKNDKNFSILNLLN